MLPLNRLKNTCAHWEVQWNWWSNLSLFEVGNVLHEEETETNATFLKKKKNSKYNPEKILYNGIQLPVTATFTCCNYLFSVKNVSPPYKLLITQKHSISIA